MIRTDIIEKFSESGFLVTQEAVVMIQESELPLAVVDEVLTAKHAGPSVSLTLDAPFGKTRAPYDLIYAYLYANVRRNGGNEII